MCEKEMGKGGLRDILFGDDPLCIDCRRMWKNKPVKFYLDDVELNASYVYNEAFSGCLIQYKELADEALKDVFLFENRKWFRRKYRGYALVMMPSTQQKIQARGFSHLKEMFACTKMEIIEPFEKTADTVQKGKSRRQRLEMMSEIRLKEGIVLPEKIVLCDDTVTTGSTLRGALHALKGYSGKIQIYTVSANRRWYRPHSLHFTDRKAIIL